MTDALDIFLVCAPGLEPQLCDEARAAGFAAPRISSGGVTVSGDWSEVWRANLCLRGAARVLVRIGQFHAAHLAQLDKRARRFPFGDVLRRDVPVRVEATCRKSRIYHARAATQRIETALRDSHGIAVDAAAALVLKLRIEKDLCTFSLDSSGAPLHQRGHKQAVGKAPMRDTLAALFLRACGYHRQMPVLDPMCGSGTFVIEAAEIALGLAPGRSRAFAFEDLASFVPAHWQAMRASAPGHSAHRFYGHDRDAGAIDMSMQNAQRAGLQDVTTFTRQPVSALTAPQGPPGLVIVNPPYGTRIGNRKLLFAIHGSLGTALRSQGFAGWRVGLITSDAGLARATALPFQPPGPYVAHGGLKVRLYQTGPLQA